MKAIDVYRLVGKTTDLIAGNVVMDWRSETHEVYITATPDFAAMFDVGVESEISLEMPDLPQNIS